MRLINITMVINSDHAHKSSTEPLRLSRINVVGRLPSISLARPPYRARASETTGTARRHSRPLPHQSAGLLSEWCAWVSYVLHPIEAYAALRLRSLQKSIKKGDFVHNYSRNYQKIWLPDGEFKSPANKSDILYKILKLCRNLQNLSQA